MIKCNVAVLMAERKMSIQDVADKTGLSRTTISALVNENGKGIQFETMDVLCELFQVAPDALFTHESAVKKYWVVDFGRINLKTLILTNDQELYETEKAQGNVGVLLDPSVLEDMGVQLGGDVYLVGREKEVAKGGEV